jgi:putative ABC transport system ATP-binding protein
MLEDERSESPALAIETNGLTRVYKVGPQDVLALRGVSLTVDAGCFVALKGRSGSGKTTLLNCIGGLDRPTGGSISIFGRDLLKMSERDLTRWRREQVGFVFQSFALLPTLSAFENVELMPRMAGRRRRECNQRTESSLDLVGLRKWMHHRPYEMSGGQQQRVAIARALANGPRLILADEPTGELDSSTARDILGIFQRIVREQHVTVLMVSHDSLVDEFADRVYHLADGQIID